MKKEYYTIEPQVYDNQFWWKKDDIEFWKNIFYDSEKSILELAAGTGRIGLSLIKENVNYKGVEISSLYCKYDNKIFQSLGHLNPIQNQDMRFFNLEKKYDNIFIGFNSFLHLMDEMDVKNCLTSVVKHMHLQSNFYIDILVPSPLFLYRPNDLALRVLEFEDNKQIIYVDEILDYDQTLEIANITWIYSNSKQELFDFQFQMKMYYPDTMHRLLIDNGFKIDNVWGDYEKNNFNEMSSKQIYQCSIV